jgi:hypothetical protein
MLFAILSTLKFRSSNGLAAGAEDERTSIMAIKESEFSLQVIGSERS